MTEPRYWILNEAHEPVPATLHEWATFFSQQGQRVVAQEHVDEYLISTVFLGVDHGWGFSDRPVLFETMVFGGPDHDEDMDQLRSCTWDEAVAVHTAFVAEYTAKVKDAKEAAQKLLQTRHDT